MHRGGSPATRRVLLPGGHPCLARAQLTGYPAGRLCSCRKASHTHHASTAIGEAEVDPGLILLGLLALLVAFGWARFRRRLGLSTSGRAWLTVMAVVILGVLLLWASSMHR